MIKFFVLLSLAMTGNEFARVGDLTGEAKIWRYGEEGAEWLTINNIIGEGDELLTYDDTYLEMEFGDGSVLSLGVNTSVYMERIEDDRTYITLNRGILRVYARERIFGVFTNGQNVYIEEGSVVRIEKNKDYFAAKVLKGMARIGNDRIYAGSEVVVDKGRYYVGKSGRADRFDRWAEEREREFYFIERVEYVPVPYYAGIHHLRRHGRWVFVRPYGWVWMPRVSRYWRPYYDGQWVYRVGLGWVWVSYEPWGWVPYRYGSWTFVSGYGWIWIPGETFAGGWVEWYYGPDWIGWAPLDYYGRPIVVINNITVVNIVNRQDFQRPIYRYKPPKGGIYKEAVYRPYNETNVKEITKFKATELEKPVYVKDSQMKKEFDSKPTVLPKQDELKGKKATDIQSQNRDEEIFPEKPQTRELKEIKSSGMDSEKGKEPYIDQKPAKPANPKFKMEEEVNIKDTRTGKQGEELTGNKKGIPVAEDGIYPERPASKNSNKVTREDEIRGKTDNKTLSPDQLPEKKFRIEKESSQSSREEVQDGTFGIEKKRISTSSNPPSKPSNEKPRVKQKVEKKEDVDDNSKNSKKELY